jgi:hypothetical protein
MGKIVILFASALFSLVTSVEAQEIVIPNVQRAVENSILYSWHEAGFTNVKIESWSDTDIYKADFLHSKKLTHATKITAVLFRGTGWTREELKIRYQRLAEIFAQCGLKIDRVELIESDAFRGWIDIRSGNLRTEPDKTIRIREIAKHVPAVNNPIIFYVRSDLNLNGSVAQAWPEFLNPAESRMQDTAWITRQVVATQGYYLPSFLTEAHELGHILANRDHENLGIPNFLSGEVRLLNSSISLSQCDAMKNHKKVRPLSNWISSEYGPSNY